MNRLIRALSPFLCLAAAVLFFIFGLNTLRAHKTYLKTTAEIVSITYDYIDDDHTDYHVLVRYTADGTERTAELGEYASSMYEGKQIDILYNPAVPGEITSAGILGILVPFAVSALSLVGAVACVISKLRGRL